MLTRAQRHTSLAVLCCLVLLVAAVGPAVLAAPTAHQPETAPNSLAATDTADTGVALNATANETVSTTNTTNTTESTNTTNTTNTTESTNTTNATNTTDSSNATNTTRSTADPAATAVRAQEVSAAPPAPPGVQDALYYDAIAGTRTQLQSATTATTHDGVDVVIEPGGTARTVRSQVEQVGTVRYTAAGNIHATVHPQAIPTLAAATTGTYIRTPTPVTQVESLPGDATTIIGGERVQNQTTGGANTTVAVIDTKINADYAPIADNVIETNQRADRETVRTSTEHGDTVAQQVVTIAPNASLVLYEAVNVDQVTQSAADIASRDDIDVAVMSLGISGSSVRLDGTDRMSQAITDGTASGTTWAIAAGNAGNDGTPRYLFEYDATQFEDRHTFGAIDGAADLTPLTAEVAEDAETGQEDRVVAGKLHWYGADAAASTLRVEVLSQEANGTYTIAKNPSGDNLIWQAEPEAQILTIGAVTNTTTKPLALRIKAVGDTPAAPDIQLYYTPKGSLGRDLGTRLTSPTITAEPVNYSVLPPATADGALAVGATQTATDGAYGDMSPVAAYSSRGPTIDGDPGITLIAPGTVTPAATAYESQVQGTSFAAPLVGGTAALLHSQSTADDRIDATPATIRSRLTTSTFNVDRAAIVAGRGHLNTPGALLPQTPATAQIQDTIPAADVDTATVTTTLPDRPATTTQVIVTATGSRNTTTTKTLDPGPQASRTITTTLDLGAFADGPVTVTAQTKEPEQPSAPSVTGITSAQITGAPGTLDTVTPTPALALSDTVLTQESANVTEAALTFSEPMNTSTTPVMTAPDVGTGLQLTNATAGSWVNTTTYQTTLQVPPNQTGTSPVTITNTTDVVGNPVDTVAEPSVTIDTAAPVVTAFTAADGENATTITLTTSEPLANGTITVTTGGEQVDTLAIETNGTTTGDTQYTTTYTPDTDGTFTFTAEGLTDTRGNEQPASSQTTATIESVTQGSLTVALTTDNATTLPAATVTITDDAGDTRSQQVTTDTVTFDALPAGVYTVSVTPQTAAYTAPDREVTVTEGTTTTTVPVTPEPVNVTGTVETATNASAVEIQAALTTNTTTAAATTTQPGSFTVESVPPGTYTLTLTAAGYETVRETVTIEPSSTPVAVGTYTLTATPDPDAPRLAGNLTSSVPGDELDAVGPALTLTATNTRTNATSEIAVTPAGTFNTTLPAGTYELNAAVGTDAYRNASQRVTLAPATPTTTTIALVPNQTLTVALPSDAPTGVTAADITIRGAGVEITPEALTNGTTPPLTLPASTYTVTTALPDGDVTRTTATVRPGTAETRVVRLTPSIEITNTTISETAVTPGQQVTIRATARNTGTTTATAVTAIRVNGTSRNQTRLTLAPNETAAITATFTATAAQTDTQLPVTVTAPQGTTAIGDLAVTAATEPADAASSSSGGGGGGGGSSGGGGGGGGGGFAAPIDAGDRAEVIAESEQRLTQKVAQGTLEATFERKTTVENVVINTVDGSGDVNVEEIDTEPDGVSETPGAEVTLTRITVPEALRTTSSTITFSVPRDAVDATGAPPAALTAMRFNDETDQWEPLETTVREQTPTQVRLDADTPGFSTFAVTVRDDVTARIDAPEQVDVGTTVTVDATNSTATYGAIEAYSWDVIDGADAVRGDMTGDVTELTPTASARITVELTVTTTTGETATDTVTIAAGDATPEPSTSERQASANESPTSAGAEVTDAEEGTNDEVPGFGSVGGLLAVLLTAVLLKRQTD